VPCLATVIAIKRETGSAKWMLFSFVYNTAVAWGLAFIIYQGGKLVGLV
jgi:ferrous iron transport protein B